MNVSIFGATGPTGLLIVEKALAAGHEVTAFVRTPEKLTITHDRLSVSQGDIYDSSAVDRAIAGADAVICTVGVPYTLKPVSVYSTASRHIVEAMQRHGVRRFIGITSGGTYDGRDPVNPFFFERILKPLFHTLYEDMREMERIAMGSGLDWTILRPSRLTDKPGTGRPRVGVDTFALPKGSTLSRDDLAETVVRHLSLSELIGHAAAVAD